MSTKKLRFGCMNIAHLPNKVHDVNVFINKTQPFHIFGISETHCQSNIPNTLLHIPNFHVIRRDMSKSSPGTTGLAVYIHNSVKKYVRRRPDLESDQVECIWLELKTPQTRNLLIGNLYRNPKSKNDWYENFLSMYDKVAKRNPNIIMMGDFNIDLLKPHTSWETTICPLGLEQLVPTPTRVTERGTATLIDHIYSNLPRATNDIRVHNLAASDHSPVSCTWSIKLPKEKKQSHTYISFRSYKNFKEADFLGDLAEAPFHEVYEETTPDAALDRWYSIFLPILNKHAPIKRRRVKNKTFPPWLSQEIIQAMKIRDRYRKQKLWDKFKQERKHVKTLVRRAKKAMVDKLIKAGKDVSSLWRAMAVVTGGSNKDAAGIPPDLSANEFNKHFVSIAETLSPTQEGDESIFCSDELKQFCSNKLSGAQPFHIPSLSAQEVRKAILSLKPKKSGGPDEINAHVLKCSIPYTSNTLTYIYNLCIQQNSFPQKLKNAKVVPIPKTKDRNDVNNYRPISLVSVLCKPLERHIHKHLTNYLESHSLIHPLQSGFRSKHSCHTAVARMTDTWLTAIDKGNITGTVFLDLKKAYDLVDHRKLLNKLKLYLGDSPSQTPDPPRQAEDSESYSTQPLSPDSTSTHPDALSFFQSYLSDRHQFVSVNGATSNLENVTRGVPQGSVLGPLLFGLFINDLPLHIKDQTVSCDLFADDTTIHTHGSDTNIPSIQSRLQSGLDKVSSWCDKNSMVVNPTKTKCMVIATRQRRQTKPLTLNLDLGGQPIRQVREHNLLGVTVDEDMRWESHTTSTCKVISSNVHLLSKLKDFVDIHGRILFYNAHIKSHIDYVSTVWDGCEDIHLKRMNSLHRQAAKHILPDPRLSTDQRLLKLNMLPLKEHLLFNKSVIMFKIHREKLPQYLCSMFKKKQSSYSTDRHHFDPKTPKLDIYKNQSLSYSGAYVWNEIPPSITNVNSLSSFKIGLFRWMFSSAHAD